MEEKLRDRYQVDSRTVESSIISDEKTIIAKRAAETERSSVFYKETNITKWAVESSSISDQEAIFIKRGAESSGLSDQEAKITIRGVESCQNRAVKTGNGEGDENLNGDSGSGVPGKDDKLSCVIDVNTGEGENQRLCRICHLSKWEIGKDLADLIELGCGCKGELGFAHSHCAEAWFKLKGNRLCEICSKTATNITGVSSIEFMDGWSEGSVISTGPFASERRSRCFNGQPLCNFLLACLVIAFVLPWFFRVNLF